MHSNQGNVPLPFHHSNGHLMLNQPAIQQMTVVKSELLDLDSKKTVLSYQEGEAQQYVEQNPGQWPQNDSNEIHNFALMPDGVNVRSQEIIGVGMDQQPNAYTPFEHTSFPPSGLEMSSDQISHSSVEPLLDEFVKEANGTFNETKRPKAFYDGSSSRQPTQAFLPISDQVYSAIKGINLEQYEDKSIIGNADDLKAMEYEKEETTSYQLTFQTDESRPTCHLCHKTFIRSCYLTQHNNAIHNGDKPFKCRRCGKRFSCADAYELHYGKHEGDKPHKCQVCPKQFNHSTDLRRHQVSHTGRSPHVCKTCGKGFARKDHMMKHCLTHFKNSQSKDVASP